MVAGALGAIGGYVTKELYERGAELLLCDLWTPEAAAERIREMGASYSTTEYRRVDFTDEVAVSKLLDNLALENAVPEAIVGIVGGTPLQPFLQTDSAEFRQTFELNFFTQVNIARAVLPLWLKRSVPGHFVFTSSLVATIPWRDLASYRSAKRALEAFSESMALDFARYHIRSNCIAPGNIAAGTALTVYNDQEEYRKTVDATIPFGSLIDPRLLARTYGWLLSEDAKEINGQIIRVDRGQSLPVVGCLGTD